MMLLAHCDLVRVSLFCLRLGHRPIYFLFIDLYNDLWLGGQPDSSSGNFFILSFITYFLLFLGGFICLLSPLFEVSKGCRAETACWYNKSESKK